MSSVTAAAAHLAERASRAVEDAQWLERPAAAATGLVNRLLKPGTAKDVLSGTPIGHPLHPVAVTLPIGAWLGASWLDLTAGETGRAAAKSLIAFGTLAAVPAAAAGASDWSDTLGAERRVGMLHAALNDVALGLYAASWFARRSGSQARGVALALAGATVVGASGWLGGHLSYALGVGVDTTAFLSGPPDWTDVGSADDLPEGQPVGVTAGPTPVLLLRRGSAVLALSDRCTHRGAPLHEGPLVGDCIECPWHGSRFRLEDGQLERGPATQSQERYEARVVDGRVQVRQPGEQRALRSNPVGSGAA